MTSRSFRWYRSGSRKEAELPDVPLLTDLAQNEEQRSMLQFVSEAAAMDGPSPAPPALSG